MFSLNTASSFMAQNSLNFYPINTSSPRYIMVEWFLLVLYVPKMQCSLKQLTVSVCSQETPTSQSNGDNMYCPKNEKLSLFSPNNVPAQWSKLSHKVAIPIRAITQPVTFKIMFEVSLRDLQKIIFLGRR